jgi:predicted outer membrane repeat protein
MTVSGYKFTENETKADGGAINNRGNNLTVNNCEFTSNKALKQNGIDGYGGAIFMFQGTLNMDVNATKVTRFEKNEATYGGAVYQKAGSITIHNAVFDENKGGWNGGAIYHKKEVTLKDCHFTANTTVSKGGALANEGGTLVATNCEFIGNISDDEGGVYRQASSGKGTFTMCTFNNNTAKNTGGGAIKFNTGSLMIDDCTFTGNKATKGDANGHDIRLSTTTTKPTIKNSTFKKSNVRDSEGTAGAYTDGGNNTLVTE